MDDDERRNILIDDCPDEIDYRYVKMPPKATYRLSFRETRVTSCEVNHSCADCEYYEQCDSDKRIPLEGREWHPALRQREEIEEELKKHIDSVSVGWLRWVLGYGK